MVELTQLFVDIDDFCIAYQRFFAHHALPATTRKRGRKCMIHPSEIMVILVWFHQQRYQNFQAYYVNHVRMFMRKEFPCLPSYSRFIELTQQVIEPLGLFFHMCRCVKSNTVSFIDSLPLPVCHNKRIYSHRVFADIAGRGKSSMGWFFGLKLHAIITPQGDFVSCTLSSANVHDVNPNIMQTLLQYGRSTQRIQGTLVGDRGYINNSLTAELAEHGIRLLTYIKKNMKPKLMAINEYALLKKRMLIECCFDLLVNSMLIRHSRYRSVKSMIATVFSGLIAYSYLTKKPSTVV
jgi:hypothetical protein